MNGQVWFFSTNESQSASTLEFRVKKNKNCPYPANLAQKARTVEFVSVPVNQNAFLGSNVTFNCTATGFPRPNITWTKDNDSDSVQYNPRLKIILTGDGNNSFSQLAIKEVKSEDYGTYHCVANNSAGEKISSATLEYRGISCHVFAV